MLGKSPERDREIEMLQQMITVAARSGVKLLLYNTTILPILRTGYTIDPLRGGVRYSTWNYAEALERGLDQETTKAGIVDVDTVYERITFLLDRLLPVAEQYGVRLANHIADPPVAAGYRGITRWNSPDVFEGIKRFARLYESPSHGFNMCIGSTAEGLRDPRTGIGPILRWVGQRRQLFNIHFRNIKGGMDDFQEVFPDNGDMNFVQVMRVLKEVDYSGMIMPDHVPGHDDPASRNQAFAFCYGYIKALVQMLDNE
jgi:mannonate dehydratase